MTNAPVHLVVPEGIDDPRRPSGGNGYDRRVCDGLAALGWTVVEHAVSPDGAWYEPASRAAFAGVLDDIPDGSLTVVDGLVGCAAPEQVMAARDRLRLVLLVHMPLGAGPDDGASGRATAEARGDEAAALAAATAVVTTSRWTRRFLLDTYALRVPVHVAVPGADVAAPASGTEDGGELLSVAALTPHKGHDVLVRALAGLTDLSWRWTVVGTLDLDPAHARRVRRAVDDAGLRSRVRFTGPLTGTALAERYASADLLVHASQAETYGMVVTEALARALPVVAASVGGVPEALGASAGRLPGRLVPVGDAGALGAALREWLANPASRIRLRTAAAARRRTLRGWTETSQRVAQVLTEAADGHAR